MPFLNPNREFKIHRLDESYYIGVVEINDDDPLKLGRVRVRVEELHGTRSPNEQLPLATEIRPSLFGSLTSKSLGMYVVPEVGSRVLIQFHRGDIYSPLYSGVPLTLRERSPDGQFEEYDTNYPERYALIDPNGTKLVVDTNEQTVLAEHVSGSKIQINASGDITVTGVQDLTYMIARDVLWEVDGNFTIQCDGTITNDSKGNFVIDTESSISGKYGRRATWSQS